MKQRIFTFYSFRLTFCFFLAFVLSSQIAKAQVKIGDNPLTVNPNSLLELESTNKGLLLVRIPLTSTTAAAPLSAHVAGMLVYNTATAGDVTPGIYYNDGTKWVRALDVETVTTLVDNGDGTYTYTSEDGTVTTIDIPGNETVTTLVDNGDGTYTYTSEDGTTTTVDIPGSIASQAATIFSNAAVVNEINNIVANAETVTTLVDNMDGTYTYTSEDGTMTTVNAGGTEPWFGTDDNMAATTNTEDIYHVGKVIVGTTAAPFANSILSTSGGDVHFRVNVDRGLYIQDNGLDGVDLTAHDFFNSGGMYRKLSLTGQNLSFFTGIGTRTEAMSIVSTAGDGSDFKVGIGTNMPHSLLDMGATLGRKLAVYDNGAGTDFYGLGVSAGLLEFYAANLNDGSEDPGMVLDGFGKVGIGFIAPSEMLDVNGNIRASGNFISGATTLTVPDYVFENYFDGNSAYNANYKLPSLSDIEAFTKQNKHLPGVDSRAEIKKNGLNLTEMQMQQLEKIEELYLHTIEQEKQIKAQQTQLDAQQKEIDELKAMVKTLMKQ